MSMDDESSKVDNRRQQQQPQSALEREEQPPRKSAGNDGGPSNDAVFTLQQAPDCQSRIEIDRDVVVDEFEPDLTTNLGGPLIKVIWPQEWKSEDLAFAAPSNIGIHTAIYGFCPLTGREAGDLLDSGGPHRNSGGLNDFPGPTRMFGLGPEKDAAWAYAVGRGGNKHGEPVTFVAAGTDGTIQETVTRSSSLASRITAPIQVTISDSNRGRLCAASCFETIIHGELAQGCIRSAMVPLMPQCQCWRPLVSIKQSPATKSDDESTLLHFQRHLYPLQALSSNSLQCSIAISSAHTDNPPSHINLQLASWRRGILHHDVFLKCPSTTSWRSHLKPPENADDSPRSCCRGVNLSGRSLLLHFRVVDVVVMSLPRGRRDHATAIARHHHHVSIRPQPMLRAVNPTIGVGQHDDDDDNGQSIEIVFVIVCQALDDTLPDHWSGMSQTASISSESIHCIDVVHHNNSNSCKGRRTDCGAVASACSAVVCSEKFECVQCNNHESRNPRDRKRKCDSAMSSLSLLESPSDGSADLQVDDTSTIIASESPSTYAHVKTAHREDCHQMQIQARPRDHVLQSWQQPVLPAHYMAKTSQLAGQERHKQHDVEDLQHGDQLHPGGLHTHEEAALAVHEAKASCQRGSDLCLCYQFNSSRKDLHQGCSSSALMASAVVMPFLLVNCLTVFALLLASRPRLASLQPDLLAHHVFNGMAPVAVGQLAPYAPLEQLPSCLLLLLLLLLFTLLLISRQRRPQSIFRSRKLMTLAAAQPDRRCQCWTSCSSLQQLCSPSAAGKPMPDARKPTTSAAEKKHKQLNGRSKAPSDNDFQRRRLAADAHDDGHSSRPERKEANDNLFTTAVSVKRGGRRFRMSSSPHLAPSPSVYSRLQLLPFPPTTKISRQRRPGEGTAATNTTKRCSWLLLSTLAATSCLISPVGASEMPERECCSNPEYTFERPPGAEGGDVMMITTAPPSVIMSFEPPELGPESLPEPPEHPGVYVPVPPTSASYNCLDARRFCLEDPTCNQILQVIPRVCGMEQVICSTVTVSKCQAALKTLRSFSYFSPTCLCKPPTPEDHECSDFSELIFDHPCLSARPAANDPYEVGALPYCTHAQDVCNGDEACKEKVVAFQRSCRVQNDKCVMSNVEECHESWQNLRLSPIFGCICHSNTQNRRRCDQIFEIVNGNPCIDAQIPEGIRPVFTNLGAAARFWEFWYAGLPGDMLANVGGGAEDSLGVPDKGRTPYVVDPPGVARTTWFSDKRTTRDVSVSEIYSSTPWNIPSATDRNFGPRPPAQNEQELINLKSTCHIALDNCERDTECRPYLEAIKGRCVDFCTKDRCMSAQQDFFRKVPRQHAMDVAFCLCKKPNDDQCFRAQHLLHPVCSQNPIGWSQREEDLPACHDVAAECRKSASCRTRLERYEQACAVDATTKTCAGPYAACRSAMLDIMGTELRMKCSCKSVAGDFRKLFDCIGYSRLFWINPCIVDVQKDYHIKQGHTEGPIVPGQFTPGGYDPEPPRPSYTTPAIRTPPPTPRPTYRPPPRQTRPPITSAPPSDYRTTLLMPFPPTQQPEWPTIPTMSTRRPRPTKPPSRRKPTDKSSTSTTTTTTLPPKYCNIENPGHNVKYIREGFEKRLYSEKEEGSELCSCKAGSVLDCTYLEEIGKKPCNTGQAFYSHNSPFYLAYRGSCLCYSGQFICAKPDLTKPKAKQATERTRVRDPVAQSVTDSPPGVYLYLGYSRIDAEVLKKGRMKLNDEVPLTDEEEELEVKNTIQQTVSHFTSNTNKSDCRIHLESRVGENYILKATLDEFDEYRMKKNMSDYMKYKEKEECYEALESIAQKVNERDADMRSHIILSMFKVAAAEANVPDPPPSRAGSALRPPALLLLLPLVILPHLAGLDQLCLLRWTYL